MDIEKRSIPVAIILSIVTFGLYGLYWQMKLTDETHELSQKKSTASGGMAVLYTIITLGIYFFYWIYKMTEEINRAKSAREMPFDDNAPFFFLVLTLFGFGFIPFILLQSSINDILDEDFGDDEDDE